MFRARFHLSEESDPAGAAALLAAIGRRGSDGVILKAPDHPLVAEAVDALVGAGIPVVTFVTDVPFSRRLAYVGADNRAAGATAAYLITRWSPQRRRRPGHPEQLVVPRRGGARDRLPRDACASWRRPGRSTR